MWLFGVMDTKSRFIIHYEAPSSKFGHDTANLFAKSIDLARKAPDAVTADALHGFAKGPVAAMSGASVLGRYTARIPG